MIDRTTWRLLHRIVKGTAVTVTTFPAAFNMTFSLTVASVVPLNHICVLVLVKSKVWLLLVWHIEPTLCVEESKTCLQGPRYFSLKKHFRWAWHGSGASHQSFLHNSWTSWSQINRSPGSSYSFLFHQFSVNSVKKSNISLTFLLRRAYTHKTPQTHTNTHCCLEVVLICQISLLAYLSCFRCIYKHSSIAVDLWLLSGLKT